MKTIVSNLRLLNHDRHLDSKLYAYKFINAHGLLTKQLKRYAFWQLHEDRSAAVDRKRKFV